MADAGLPVALLLVAFASVLDAQIETPGVSVRSGRQALPDGLLFVRWGLMSFPSAALPCALRLAP